MATRNDISLAVLRYYVEQLGEVAQGVTDQHGGQLQNAWVVPYIEQQLRRLDPDYAPLNASDDEEPGEERQPPNYEEYRTWDLEQRARDNMENYRAGDQNVDELATLLPVDSVFQIAGQLNQMKAWLYDRVDAEVDALIERYGDGWDDESVATTDIVTPEYMATITAGAREAYEEFRADFAESMNTIIDYAYNIATAAAGSLGALEELHTRIEAQGGIAGYSFEVLKQKAAALLDMDAEEWQLNWNPNVIAALPHDIDVAGTSIIEGYKVFEDGLMEQRYGQ